MLCALHKSVLLRWKACICISKNEDAELLIKVANLAFLKPEFEILDTF